MFFYLKKSTNIFRNSSGAVAVSVGSVQFQTAPPSSLHYSISTGPFWCSGCHLQGFYSVAPVPSEAVPFVYLASVCRSLQRLISALTQAGGGGLIQVASSVALPGRGGPGAAFPSPLLRLPAALYGAGPASHAVPAVGCSTKAWNKKLRLLFASSPPERLRQPGACRAHSPRCGAPSALSILSPSPCPRRSGACALCLAATPRGGC